MYYKVLDKNEKGELTSTMMKGKDSITYKIGEFSETTKWGKIRDLGIYICFTKEQSQHYIDLVKKEGIVDVSNWNIYEVETQGEVKQFGNWFMCDMVKVINTPLAQFGRAENL